MMLQSVHDEQINLSFGGEALPDLEDSQSYLQFIEDEIERVQQRLDLIQERKRLVQESSFYRKSGERALRERTAGNLPSSLSERTFPKEKQPVCGKALKIGVLQFQQLGKVLDLMRADSDNIWEELSAIQALSCRSDGVEPDVDIDWDLLAKHQFPRKTGKELEIQYRNCSAPWIKSSKWKKEELALLIKVVASQEKKKLNWVQISEKIAGRTPFDCFREVAKIYLKKRPDGPWWSFEEDERLRELVLEYGQENWKEISLRLNTQRTSHQCWHRWHKATNPDISKGQWSQEEDVRLVLAKKFYEKEDKKVIWQDIVNQVPTRTGVQVRERYISCIDPGRKKFCAKWEDSDLELLRKTAAEIGEGKWSKISKQMGSKFTARQCRMQFKKMKIKKEKQESSNKKNKRKSSKKQGKKRKLSPLTPLSKNGRLQIRKKRKKNLKEPQLGDVSIC